MTQGLFNSKTSKETSRARGAQSEVEGRLLQPCPKENPARTLTNSEGPSFEQGLENDVRRASRSPCRSQKRAVLVVFTAATEEVKTEPANEAPTGELQSEPQSMILYVPAKENITTFAAQTQRVNWDRLTKRRHLHVHGDNLPVPKECPRTTFLFQCDR
ncbi:hypothetical protein MTO96_049744 [Rhipicephalus appendiculatus]